MYIFLLIFIHQLICQLDHFYILCVRVFGHFPLRSFCLLSSIYVTYVLMYIFLLKFIHQLVSQLGHFYILSVRVFDHFSSPCHFPLRSPCSLSSPPIHVDIFNVHFSIDIYTSTYLSTWSFLYSLCSCL